MITTASVEGIRMLALKYFEMGRGGHLHDE